MEKYNIEYESKGFFMGISDLSYATWSGNDADIECIKSNSPGWDTLYRIPFGKLKTLDVPIINLGPWGKDLHKITERVFTKDVYEVIPNIMLEIIKACYK